MDSGLDSNTHIMKTIGDRLKYARETAHDRIGRVHKITQTELGERMGLHQTTVVSIESNRNKNLDVGVDKLSKAASFLKVSFMWLAFGIGELSNIDAEMIQELEKLKGLPMFFPQNVTTRRDEEVQQVFNISETIAKKIGSNSFFTVVSDNGLSPQLQRGDLALIDPDVPPSVEDFVLVSIPNYRLPVIRKILERSLEQYTLMPVNENMPEIPLSEDSHMIGVVFEFRHWPLEELRIKGWQEENRKPISNIVSLRKTN